MHYIKLAAITDLIVAVTIYLGNIIFHPLSALIGGVTQELNRVLELNSRWNEGGNTTPPIINPKIIWSKSLWGLSYI